MAFDNAELSKVIREVLDPKVRELTNKSAIVWNLLGEGKTEQTNPRGVRLVAEARQNQSQLWFDEGGVYPVGGGRTFVSMTVTFRRYAIASQLTRDTLENKASALVDVMKDSVKHDTRQALIELNQQSFRDGSGVKAVVASATTSGGNTVVTFAAPFGSRQIQITGDYSFYDSTGATQRGGAGAFYNCINRNLAALTATFSGTALAALLSAGDVVTLKNSYGKAIHGLDYIVSNATTDYFGVDRSLYEQFRAISHDASSGALTVAMLHSNLFKLKYIKGADHAMQDDMIIVSSPAQAHRYVNLGDPTQAGTATAIRRETKLRDPLDLGYTTYSFNGMRWVEDTDCPDNVLYILNRKFIHKFEFKPLGIVPLVGTENGLAPIPAFDSNGAGAYKDSGVYIMTWKGDLASPDPAQSLKIRNLDTTNLANGNF